MQDPLLKYFPRTLSNQAIMAFGVALLACTVLFLSRSLPVMWMAFSVIVLTGFFLFFNSISRKWTGIGPRTFTRKLFAYAFWIRLGWVVFSYFFFQYMTGSPFEFSAGDSMMYHNAANSVLYHGYDNLSSGLWGLGLSDSGYPFYLSLIYFVFGDHVIIPRLINALLGAWTVVLVYRLAGRNFGEATGRLAGIMMMLIPNFIYYCGIHLKETLMVFLLVAFMERADLLLRRKIRAADLLLLAGIGAAMFFFRTVLMASMLFALFSMVLFIRRQGANWMQRSIIGLWVVITVWLTFSYRIQTEFEYLLENVDAQEANMEFKSVREGGNRLANYGSSVVFAPVMFVAPFPTFVNVSTQQTQMMLSGGYFVKNVLAFFVALSLISFIRKRELRKYIFILSFLLAYLAILAQSSFALSERFHLPALPFLIILAAYGITQFNYKTQRYYIPYLALLVIAVIAWNVFKLAGRGGI